MKKAIHIAALALAILLATGFLLVSCDKKQADSGKPVIAVSIVPEATFVRAVCGGLAEVVTLIPPGYSPENYEPTPGDMMRFEEASLYFTIGIPAEAGILPHVPKSVKIVALHEEVAEVYPELTFASGDRDPHIWLSPKRVKVMIEVITRELSLLDPDNAGVYSQNAAAYQGQLEGLDSEIVSALEGVKNRKIIVYHPAFGYLAEDYGLTMYALEEEGKEATAKRLAEMVELARAENIKVIFYQEEIDNSQSAAFAEEIGGVAIKLSPLAADYIDNLKKMAELLAEAMQ
ncbi:MAG TPA: zinc ABC transporter substrate-binding protein [Bacillota bacterium]|nr:zinc ABC transporter substrate-binding protein [Bacillota bacterium]